MAKQADRYFQTKEWSIKEEGFDSKHAKVAESIFSLGNEYMGVRGYFEEGYSSDHLIGSYFNGIYERTEHNSRGYKGEVHTTEYMLNSVNWLYTRIFIDEERLDLSRVKFKHFFRELDFKNATLTRSFRWITKTKKEIEITFQRMLSMEEATYGLQKVSFRALNFSGDINLEMGLDFSELHQNTMENVWNCSEQTSTEDYFSIMGETQNTNQSVFCACKLKGDFNHKKSLIQEKFVGATYTLHLEAGEQNEITRIVQNQVCKKEEELPDFLIRKQAVQEQLQEANFEELVKKNAQWWDRTWENSDITVEGDVLNQQGIRFCIFQMFQTYHGAVAGANIGAKGLTGEAYNGNAFWDTETYCLPFYIFNNMQAAKNLLIYRYQTLPEAKKRAVELDCEGAFYPIATISGTECCNLWQHASLQLQASTAVAYGIWFYEKMSKDQDFMQKYGAEMLVEICRMLATRGAFSADGKQYGFYGVMGPDEFQMMVHNNCYTNFMGRLTLNYTQKVLLDMQKNIPMFYQELTKKLKLTSEEVSYWKKIEEAMYIPYDSNTKIYEQHEGFFKLPHIDVDQIPIEEFPLYHNWTYDRIYRNDMIKQPDVLMMMFLFNSSFTEEEIQKNYEYYEPRCIHESSLSPSVHSVLANQIHKKSEAFSFFEFATRMDLDNYNRNSDEGLHTTSIAAAWINIVYGFGGMRSDREILSFAPSLPTQWHAYSFRVTYHDSVIKIQIEQEQVTFQRLKGESLSIEIYGKTYFLDQKEIVLSIPKEWR